MKRCKRCQIEYPLEEFLRIRSGLHARCHNCRRETHREYYRNARQDIKAWIYNYLLDNPCIDCGESDPMRLTFDHRENKHFDLGKAFIGKAKDLGSVQLEIAKCDVRCANCHIVKTHIEQDTWKYRMSVERNAHGNTTINS
jgi:hypothetical protein